jgi:hypothetical protein
VILGTYLRGLHPSTQRSVRQALAEAMGGRPETAGALLAGLPADQLAPALTAVLEAYAAQLVQGGAERRVGTQVETGGIDHG